MFVLQLWNMTLVFCFFVIFFIVVHVHLSAFPPDNFPTTPAIPTCLPCFQPLWFCLSVLYSCSWKGTTQGASITPPLSPHTSPLVTISLFLISMSLVIFCLLFSFVDYIPVKGGIIWYLSLTAWLISLSIMLSSSIHAVVKGRSSFFSLFCIEFHCVNVP